MLTYLGSSCIDDCRISTWLTSLWFKEERSVSWHHTQTLGATETASICLNTLNWYISYNVRGRRGAGNNIKGWQGDAGQWQREARIFYLQDWINSPRVKQRQGQDGMGMPLRRPRVSQCARTICHPSWPCPTDPVSCPQHVTHFDVPLLAAESWLQHLLLNLETNRFSKSQWWMVSRKDMRSRISQTLTTSSSSVNHYDHKYCQARRSRKNKKKQN